jgi:very-short-patch-repair endonuclease
MAELARRQHGVVARWQLAEIGLCNDAICHRIAGGRLHRLHAGVYAVGHLALPREGGWIAAVLAAGDGAVLSHASAAALWGLMPSAPRLPEVTVPRSSRSTPRLRRHCSFLAPDEIATQNAIPVTSVARTLFDMAAQTRPWEFERLVREAEFLKLPQVPSLSELYTRHPRRRGARLVRLTLEGLSEFRDGTTRSSLEDRFLRFVRRAGLPLPETNVRLKFSGVTYEADCLWREAGVIVELDGHRAHGTRAAFERDRERDRRMQVAGWQVIRVTWRQLQAPGSLSRDLRQLLAPIHESAVGGPRAP